MTTITWIPEVRIYRDTEITNYFATVAGLELIVDQPDPSDPYRYAIRNADGRELAFADGFRTATAAQAAVGALLSR